MSKQPQQSSQDLVSMRTEPYVCAVSGVQNYPITNASGSADIGNITLQIDFAYTYSIRIPKLSGTAEMTADIKKAPDGTPADHYCVSNPPKDSTKHQLKISLHEKVTVNKGNKSIYIVPHQSYCWKVEFKAGEHNLIGAKGDTDRQLLCERNNDYTIHIDDGTRALIEQHGLTISLTPPLHGIDYEERQFSTITTTSEGSRRHTHYDMNGITKPQRIYTTPTHHRNNDADPHRALTIEFLEHEAFNSAPGVECYKHTEIGDLGQFFIQGATEQPIHWFPQNYLDLLRIEAKILSRFNRIERYASKTQPTNLFTTNITGVGVVQSFKHPSRTIIGSPLFLWQQYEHRSDTTVGNDGQPSQGPS